jgi:excisionase family DNA binding protein
MSVPKGIGEDGHLSTAEVAARVGVDRTTVWHWIKTGLLRSVRYGDEKTFHGVNPKEVERFLAIYKIPPPKAKKRAKKKTTKKNAKKSTKRAKKKGLVKK